MNKIQMTRIRGFMHSHAEVYKTSKAMHFFSMAGDKIEFLDMPAGTHVLVQKKIRGKYDHKDTFLLMLASPNTDRERYSCVANAEETWFTTVCALEALASAADAQ